MTDKQDKLINQMLLKTARTFSLTLKALPIPIRRPLSIAYILARCSDTIADVEGLSNDRLLFILDTFKEVVNSGPDQEKIAQMSSCMLAYPKGSTDYILLSNFEHYIIWLYALDKPMRDKIIKVLNTIIQGQREDVTRFRLNEQLACLETIDELEHYTYAVAGCVGEFWTDLCVFKLPEYSNLSTDILYQYAIDFGKGLQLINILRDLPDDIAHGRCYLPREQLRQHNLHLDDVKENIQKLSPIIIGWIEKAIVLLQHGWVYMKSLKNRRIKSALALQLMTGFATLHKLTHENYLTNTQPLKVSRKEFRHLRVIALLCLFSDKALYLTRYLDCAHLVPQQT